MHMKQTVPPRCSMNPKREGRKSFRFLATEENCKRGAFFSSQKNLVGREGGHDRGRPRIPPGKRKRPRAWEASRGDRESFYGQGEKKEVEAEKASVSVSPAGERNRVSLSS